MLYQNIDQAHLRLTNTVVLYDNIFVEVLNVGSFADFRKQRPEGRMDICLRLYDPTIKSDPEDGRYRYVALDDPKLRYTNITLGYVNTARGAFYAMRKPSRSQKQGLSRENAFLLAADDYRGDQPYKISELAKGNGTLFTTAKGAQDAADNLVHSRYPSVDSAVKHIRNNENCRSRAVSRQLCLVYDNDLDVVYVVNRGIRIGMWYPKSGLTLSGRNKCFAEEASKVFSKVTINDSEAA